MILPAVLEIDPKKELLRVAELASFSNMLHVDVMDGKFVEKKNLNILNALTKGASQADFELHLMVEHPAKLFPDIRKIKRVKRIVLQIESDWKSAFKKFKKHYEVGIALKPETPILEISKYRNIEISFIHLLSIKPGAQGNPFRPEVYKRMKEVRTLFPKISIEIDGAMNPARIKRLKQLGANDFVVGSFLKKGNVGHKMNVLCNI